MDFIQYFMYQLYEHKIYFIILKIYIYYYLTFIKHILQYQLDDLESYIKKINIIFPLDQL